MRRNIIRNPLPGPWILDARVRATAGKTLLQNGWVRMLHGTAGTYSAIPLALPRSNGRFWLEFKVIVVLYASLGIAPISKSGMQPGAALTGVYRKLLGASTTKAYDRWPWNSTEYGDDTPNNSYAAGDYGAMAVDLDRGRIGWWRNGLFLGWMGSAYGDDHHLWHRAMYVPYFEVSATTGTPEILVNLGQVPWVYPPDPYFGDVWLPPGPALLSHLGLLASAVPTPMLQVIPREAGRGDRHMRGRVVRMGFPPLGGPEPTWYPGLLMPHRWAGARSPGKGGRVWRPAPTPAILAEPPAQCQPPRLRHAGASGRRVPAGGTVRVIAAPMIDMRRWHALCATWWRIFSDAEIRLYRSDTADPDQSGTPYATPASLPATPATTFADGDWRVAGRRWNGVLASGEGEVTHIVISGDSGDPGPPTAPVGQACEQRPGGVVRVIAVYDPGADASPATYWAITYTTNGSTPAGDNPTQVVAMGGHQGLQRLRLDLPAQADGTTLKVRVQSRRGAAGSLSVPLSDVVTIVVEATLPTAPETGDAWAGEVTG